MSLIGAFTRCWSCYRFSVGLEPSAQQSTFELFNIIPMPYLPSGKDLPFSETIYEIPRGLRVDVHRFGCSSHPCRDSPPMDPKGRDPSPNLALGWRLAVSLDPRVLVFRWIEYHHFRF